MVAGETKASWSLLLSVLEFSSTHLSPLFLCPIYGKCLVIIPLVLSCSLSCLFQPPVSSRNRSLWEYNSNLQPLSTAVYFVASKNNFLKNHLYFLAQQPLVAP